MRTPYIKAFITVFIWGAGFVFTKFALESFSPVFVVFTRFGIGLLLLGITVFQRKEFKFPPRKELLYLMLTGFLGVTFHQWLQATGLLTASATTTAWIVSTIPMITFIFGVIFLKENGTALNLLGIIIASGGIIWVVSQGHPKEMFSSSFTGTGDFLIVISAFNWAVFSILSRKGLRKHPPALMMLYVMFFGWLFSGFWLLQDGQILRAGVIAPQTIGVLSLLELGLLGSGIAYIFWYDALKELPAYKLSVFIYIEPIVTMILAAVLINETITPATMIGGAITIAGIIMVNQKKRSITDQQSNA